MVFSGKYAKYGSYGEDEATCTHESNDVSYLGMTSFKIPSMITGNGPNWTTGDVPRESPYTSHNIGGDLSYHIAAALLRMILKETFNYDVVDPELPLAIISNGPGGGGSYVSNPGFRIDFVYCDTDNPYNDLTKAERMPSKFDVAFRVYSNHETSTSGTNNPQRTFRSLARLIAQLIGNNFIGRTEDTGAGHNDLNRYLHGYYVTVPDGLSITTTGDNLGRLPYGYKSLHDRYMKCYSRAEMTIQNVSPASDAAELADLDADRIDSMPLQGRIYKFKDPFPRVAYDNNVSLVAGNSYGYTLQGAYNVSNAIIFDTGANTVNGGALLQFDVDNDGIIRPKTDLSGVWYKIPDKDMFSNCSAMAPFMQRPGAMHKFELKFEFDGTINNFIKKLYLSNAGTVVHRSRSFGNELGTSMLIAAEKRMSVQSANLIKHNIQVCYYAGAYFKRPKPQVMHSMKFDTHSSKELIEKDIAYVA